MDLHLTGRTVLVTGGSKGIGEACAAGFAAEGARVAIAARDPDNLAAAARRLRDLGAEVATAAVDLTQPEAAERMVRDVEQALGPLDVLVNCAGAARRTPAAELTAAHWHAAMQAKYFTYIHAMQAVLPGMAARGRGAVINVVGSGGKLASPTHLAGGAANAALMLASAGLAAAWGPRGLRVNAVNPGPTLTDRLEQGLKAEARMTGLSLEETMRQRVGDAPLQRIATAEEIANVVVFLASDRASYVSGAVIALDGARIPTVV